jgi:hypothetical protein
MSLITASFVMTHYLDMKDNSFEHSDNIGMINLLWAIRRLILQSLVQRIGFDLIIRMRFFNMLILFLFGLEIQVAKSAFYW